MIKQQNLLKKLPNYFKEFYKNSAEKHGFPMDVAFD